jgi:Na+-transporting methylmalonyl-CoA/oxaloacetate decarboxylase gamma subunit
MRDILDGLFLMGVGMGTVFLFLGLMIATTGVIRRLCAGPAPASGPPDAPGGPGGPGEDAEALRAAVIAATLTHHRRRG